MDCPPTLDAHAHVWDRSCRFVSPRRYTPDYEATIDTYLALLDAHAIERAVLVQPSFLGSDNSYLLSALTNHPHRLRGIVVLDPETTADQIAAMDDAGVIGLRLNMIGKQPASLAPAAVQTLLRNATDQGWWIEIHANGAELPAILDHIPQDACLMIDHFGRPSAPACPGIARLLTITPDRLCLKLSAPYRLTPPHDVTAAGDLIAHVTPARCLWGSDWPWTEHEQSHVYAETMSWLDAWLRPGEHEIRNACAPTLAGF